MMKIMVAAASLMLFFSLLQLGEVQADMSLDQATAGAKAVDYDGDGLSSYDDNCPGIYNPSQLDSDHNKKGDVCEPTVIAANWTTADLDNDGDIDEEDYKVFNSMRGSCIRMYGFRKQSDYDGDGCITDRDMTFFWAYNTYYREEIYLPGLNSKAR